MSHIDIELKQIQEKLLEMWDLVEYQLVSSREALLNYDLELAVRVVKLGKKVNRYDTKIDRMCENFFALFTPVAVDLRRVLAIIKINSNLERIGDTAEGICRIVQKLPGPLPEMLAQESRLLEMYETTLLMLSDSQKILTKYDSEEAHAILKQDKLINKIYRKSDKILIEYMQQDPAHIGTGLQLYTLIKKMERVGDQITNITEEIIFYHDAKMIKHSSDKKKKNKNKE